VRAYESCERMVAAAVARSGHLDILVNCAAGNFLAPAEELTSNGFRTVMEIDAVGTFNMCRWAGCCWASSGGCCVVAAAAASHAAAAVGSESSYECTPGEGVRVETWVQRAHLGGRLARCLVARTAAACRPAFPQLSKALYPGPQSLNSIVRPPNPNTQGCLPAPEQGRRRNHRQHQCHASLRSHLVPNARLGRQGTPRLAAAQYGGFPAIKNPHGPALCTRPLHLRCPRYPPPPLPPAEPLHFCPRRRLWTA
jgi:hypothetical protein